MPATFGLIDGNAFCSCERAFAPKLRGRAVVVLSNNDGCAIALDAVNARHGRGALRPLATGLARPWGTRHGRLSPRYTTRVEELMEAEAW